MKPSHHDREKLRALAAEAAAVAALPVQEEKRRLWRALNRLEPRRPMVMVDQVCWNEMNVDDELTLVCADPECRAYEVQLRRTLYQWRHFPVDMVVEPFIRVPEAIQDSGFGIQVREEVAASDPSSEVLGHRFLNQFEVDRDLDKIRTPRLTHDAVETARRLELAHWLFDGTLEVVPQGLDPYLSVWDPISAWMSVEDALYGLVDRPEFMKALVRRMVDGYMQMLDQAEADGLLCHHQSLIHCTGAYTDELPAPGFDPRQPRTRDLWMFGLAQMLATVSPEMFAEFEIEPCLPLFARFGLVYYGCCDPLDRKLEQVKRIPNVRKISISPWADEERSAVQIGADYVFSRKPNPALLAWDVFDEAEARNHLQQTIDTCARHGCPLELIFKDISTVRYQPQRLWRWAEMAMQLVASA